MKRISGCIKPPQKVQQQQAQSKLKSPTIGGIELTPSQWETLKKGGFVYLENMKRGDNNSQFSSFVFLYDEKDKAFFNDKNPDEFVKYGKYEIRIRDKILIEKGYVTKTKVKWWGERIKKLPKNLS